MSEFKNDKTSLENAKFDFSNDHHDLYEHLHRVENEHKQMLEMLKSFVNDFDNDLIEDFQRPRDRFEQLIKQAIDINTLNK